MNSIIRHNLTKATLVAGSAVMTKSASASPEQSEILAAAWPAEETTKLAALSQVLASGLMVEEAEASTA
jgi:hypothetical protein